LRTKSSGKDLPFSLVKERWRLLIANARDYMGLPWNHDDPGEASAFVTATRPNSTALDDDVLRLWVVDLAARVHKSLV
jgi:hypothetical protein